MSALRYLALTAVLALPVFFSITPAQAITARQYAAQGHGVYLTSKGIPERYHRGYYSRRGWYPHGHWYRRRVYY